MNSGYFYCPYIELDDDPASKEEKPQEDFPYEVGEAVWIEGAPERQYNQSWRARIVKRWYDEDNPKPHKYSPYNFVVEPIDDPPPYRIKQEGWPIIVGEGEISRFRNQYPGNP